MTHIDQTEKFLHYSLLNGSVKSAVALFVAYLAGFILLSIGAALVVLFYASGYTLGLIIRKRASTTSDASKNVVWRRIVTIALSTPIIELQEPAVSAEDLERKLKVVVEGASTLDTDLLVKTLAEVAATEIHRTGLDTEWHYLYLVLQCYFYKEPPEDVWYTLSTLYGLSIALGISGAFPSSTSTLLWLLCVLCALISTVLSLFVGLDRVVSEPYDGVLGARILKEWKAPKPQP